MRNKELMTIELRELAELQKDIKFIAAQIKGGKGSAELLKELHAKADKFSERLAIINLDNVACELERSWVRE